jgi:hypothetical protein
LVTGALGERDCWEEHQKRIEQPSAHLESSFQAK